MNMPTCPEVAARRARLLRHIRREKLDALLVTNVHNVRYLTGFPSEDSALLVTPERTWLLTDSRYAEQAEAETRGIGIIVRKKAMMPVAAATARKAGVRTLGVEECVMTMAEARELRNALPHAEVKRTRGMVEQLRMIKDASEIAAISRAAEIADEALRLTLPHVAPGKTERQLALILERTMQDLGADGPAFPTIVAAGERTSLPHARPTDRRIRRGEAVLFDWGARWKLYASDSTRVIFLDGIPDDFQRRYRRVLAAQRRALARVKVGCSVGKLDAAARSYLKAHRCGKYFSHSLGHGVGLEVHEAPGIGPGQSVVLKAGMVITLEPGVYVPGQGGVRIEDLLLVTRTGAQILTASPKWPPSVLLGS
jgi:Xaa-Pro aminopeptidase